MNSFKKYERLCSRKEIDRLFEQGSSFGSYPFRILFIENPEEKIQPVKVGISIPKKTFKSAVKRNLLKRRIREAYRINKQELYAALKKENKCYSVMIIYTAKEITDYQFIESKIIVTLQRLILEIEK